MARLEDAADTRREARIAGPWVIARSARGTIGSDARGPEARATRRSALRFFVAVGSALSMLSVTGGTMAGLRAPRGPADADLEIVLLHGTKDGTDQTPPGYPELKSPPWNAYDHYEVLLTKKVALTKGTIAKESLPDGSSLETTLLETAPKYKLEVVVKEGGGAQLSKGKYSIAKGTRFMPFAAPYKGGNLVVGLKVL